MCLCIFNHFYAVGPKSYWVRQNNANYKAIMPLKVIQGKPILVQIESPYVTSYYWLPPTYRLILYRFQVTADYWSNFRYRRGGALV